MFSFTTIFSRRLFVSKFLLLAIMLSSCSAPVVETPTTVLRPNIVTTVKSFGEYFHSEIVDIDGPIVVWESSWDGQVVVLEKMFQNIFPVSINEGRSSFYNEFDKSQLEPLFPLKIGNQVIFEGVQYHSKNHAGAMFWAAISVTGSDTIKIDREIYEVLVINIVTQTVVENAIQINRVTLWHASDLGINLRTKYQNKLGDDISQPVKFEVVKIEFPEGLRGQRNNVGTTRINHETVQPEDNNLVVLNEAKF
jgi:hypothetical protein